MRKTIFHSESVLHLESSLHLESFFHFFLCRLCSSLGLSFSVRFASLLATTTTLFVFSLRFVLHSLCFPLRICSSLRLWSSTEFGFFGLVILYLVIFSSLRLSFIQILLFIQTLLFNRFFLQLLIQIKTWVQEKNKSFCESHWFSIDFSLFTWALFCIWTMNITINPDFFYPVRIKRSTAAHAFIHDLQLALN